MMLIEKFLDFFRQKIKSRLHSLCVEAASCRIIRDIFGNVSDLAGQNGTQLVQSLGLHIIVGPETADSFAVNAAFFSQLIGGDAFFLHQHP